MQRHHLSDAVNGGYIENEVLDLRRGALSLRVEVLDNGRLTGYDIVFQKVSHLEFETDSRSDAGDRLQMTELWIDAGPEESPTEEWAITISIFDLTHIRLRCSSITVDRETVR